MANLINHYQLLYFYQVLIINDFEILRIIIIYSLEGFKSNIQIFNMMSQNKHFL
jgi:hypothetical protein